MGADLSSEFANVSSDLAYVVSSALLTNIIDKELNCFIIYYVALQSINEVGKSVLIQSHPS